METLGEYLQNFFFFGLIGFSLLWIAKANGFFILPERKPLFISFKSLLVVFSIYLGMTLFIAPLLATLARSIYHFFYGTNPSASLFGWIQFLLLIATLLLLLLYAKANDPRGFKRIWKDPLSNKEGSSTSLCTDFFLGVMTWLISFPVVLAIGQLVDMLLYYLFQFESFEQVAVRYLKSTLESPERLVVALLTILVLAPLIEEFLFRGCLQTFLKRYFSPPKAIILSSLCFALFHYAGSQGLGNISLVISLFTFALFLGFLYERQGSLLSNIGLHMTFNAFSALRILFFSES